MQAINYRRVAVGGLLASAVLLVGEIVLIGSLRTRLMAAREAAHMPTTPPNPLLAVTELLLTGFLLTWIYAAIRPRFGAGALTAVRSGVTAWVALGLIVTIHTVNDSFGLPTYLILVIGAGVLPCLVAANVAGAWAYRERG